MWEGIFAITRIITAIITGIAGPFMVWWLKEVYYSDGKNVEEDNDKIEIEENIKSELEQIRQEISADRIWVAQFHNGGNLLDSVRDASMKKLSITYERTGAGVSEERDKVSNVLVSFFTEMIGRIISEDYVKYGNGEVDVDPEVELLFRQRGTKKMHLFAMRDIDGMLIGIMGVDYVDENYDLDKEEIQYLDAKASLLAGYIFYRKVKQKE